MNIFMDGLPLSTAFVVHHCLDSDDIGSGDLYDLPSVSLYHILLCTYNFKQ